MSAKERIEELQEKKLEFILNESVFENENPSWGEIVESQNDAERKWEETEEGRELNALLKWEISVEFDENTGEKTVRVLQECNNCGDQFLVLYRSNGNYEYIEDSCNCESDFSPVGENPSITQWIEYSL